MDSRSWESGGAQGGVGRGLGPGSKCEGGPGGRHWAQGCGAASLSGAPGPLRLHSANTPWMRGEAFRKRCLTSATTKGSETSGASLKSTSRGRRERCPADSQDLTPTSSALAVPPVERPSGLQCPGALPPDTCPGGGVGPGGGGRPGVGGSVPVWGGFPRVGRSAPIWGVCPDVGHLHQYGDSVPVWGVCPGVGGLP